MQTNGDGVEKLKWEKNRKPRNMANSVKYSEGNQNKQERRN
jgi:hypothetical protein